MVVAGHLAAVGIRIDNVRVVRVGRDIAAFAATDRVPVLTPDHALIVAAGNRDSRVVLLGTIHAVGPVVVDSDVIELRGRLVFLLRPGFAAIDRERRAAVVAIDQMPRIARIYPQRVMVAVRGGQQLEILTAVGGAERAGVQHIDGVHGDRIGKNMRVVPGALSEAVIRIDPRPTSAAIIGAENSTLLRFDGRIDTAAVRARDGNADAAQRTGGKTVAFDLLPGDSAVRGTVKSRPGAAARKSPRLTAHLPERGEQGVGIPRVENYIDPTRVAVSEQHPLPGLAAIARSKNSALVVRSERVPERRDEYDIRVVRIDDYGADLTRIDESDVLPCLAGIE